MWRASRNKFPAGPSEGLKRWSLGPLNNNPLEYFTKVAREYGDIAGMRVLNFKNIFINHPDLIEEVLVTNARKYSKGRVLRANRHVFGEGLLTSEGDFWLRQRRLAQPAFHRGRIASYAAAMGGYTMRNTWANRWNCFSKSAPMSGAQSLCRIGCPLPRTCVLSGKWRRSKKFFTAS